MENQIRQSVENVSHHHFSTLGKVLDETISQLTNLIRLDEYHRHGHQESQLEKDLGPLGSSNFDFSTLSQILGKSTSSRCLNQDRLNRVDGLLKKLKQIRKSGYSPFYSFSSIDLNEDESIIQEKSEEHFNQMADLFGTLRIAQLEVRSKYSARTHDSVFRRFNWEQLSPAELSLCPPFLVIAHLDHNSGKKLRKIMALLETRKPIKIVALKTSLRRFYSHAYTVEVPATMAVEMMPLAMRGIYFLQTNIATPNFEKSILEALTSPRPTLLSLLAQKEKEEEIPFHLRAERALQSRAFPAVVYNPDLANRFVSCFNLSANPMPDDNYTFADFAASQKEFKEDFTDPSDEILEEDLVPISDYLELNRNQRLGKIPCIYLAGNDGKLHPKMVSQNVVTQSFDQIHLWKTLQEMAGVDNPYVNTTKATLQAEFDVQQKALLKSLQEEIDRDQNHRQEVTTAATIRDLVAHLTEVDPMDIDIRSMINGTQDSAQTIKGSN